MNLQNALKEEQKVYPQIEWSFINQKIEIVQKVKLNFTDNLAQVERKEFLTQMLQQIDIIKDRLVLEQFHGEKLNFVILTIMEYKGSLLGALAQIEPND